MILIFLIIVFFPNTLKTQSDVDYEAALKTALFKTASYDNTLRPSNPTYISLKLQLNQIVGLNERTEIITTSSFLFVSWSDSRLSWNPGDYGQIQILSLSANAIWLPDLYVINTANTNGFLSYTNYRIYVTCNGLVYMNIGLISLSTICKSEIYKFPFDVQTCSIIIGSWFQDAGLVYIYTDTTFQNISSMKTYSENSIWAIESTNASTKIESSRFLGVTYTIDFYFNITMRRKPSYYLYSNVYPCLILNCVTLSTFFFPFILQASITLTTFLNLAMISVRSSNDIPVQSNYMPLISLYFFLCLLYTFISFMWFTFLEQLRSRKHILTKLARVLSKEVVQEDSPNAGETEKIIKYLNWIAFFIMFLIMFISFISIWLAVL